MARTALPDQLTGWGSSLVWKVAVVFSPLSSSVITTSAVSPRRSLGLMIRALAELFTPMRGESSDRKLEAEAERARSPSIG